MSYFDLGDNKSCDLKTFARALDKFGCNFKDHEIKALFNKYDVNKSGDLDYEEFSKLLMEIDISNLSTKPNMLKTLGTNYFKITH
jgi:Ca2+-binding EF-hand superfamily protein